MSELPKPYTRDTWVEVENIFDAFIGADKIYEQLTGGKKPPVNYPPYNIIGHSDDEYVIQVAVAGFRQEEIAITLENRKLKIVGKKVQEEPNTPVQTFIHKGISSRDFDLVFSLAEFIEVISAYCQDGLMSIALKRIVPDEKKPKEIPLGYRRYPQETDPVPSPKVLLQE